MRYSTCHFTLHTSIWQGNANGWHGSFVMINSAIIMMGWICSSNNELAWIAQAQRVDDSCTPSAL
jgi:hypothetical protein